MSHSFAFYKETERLSESTSKCGMDCGTCPWGPYPRKNMTPEEFDRYRRNAKKVLGYSPIRTPCATCQTPDDQIPKESKLPSRKCLIRVCANKTGVNNCAYCSRFPCEAMNSISGLWTRKKFEEKLGSPISEEEYHAFVEPFEGLRRLQKIRASLKTKEIIDAKKVPQLKIKVVAFPDNIPFSKEEATAFKKVHKLLATIKNSSLGLKDTDTFAQQQTLEKRMAHILRFLWILGCYGEIEKKNGGNLTVNAKTYISNRGSEKSLAIWSFVRETIFKTLQEFKVQCERVPLKATKEENLATGTGYLRSKGWIIKMSFEEKAGGFAAVQALQSYAKRLNAKYGKKAFQHFSEIDMRVLGGDY